MKKFTFKRKSGYTLGTIRVVKVKGDSTCGCGKTIEAGESCIEMTSTAYPIRICSKCSQKLLKVVETCV